ncbi:hypothetical protein CJD36_011395 [Flavipsychrobacter stenotrophus]|uniref:Ig-like domain-containing protein n=1 Tax=Flavipsychrobacter stenotrophus TaxID=2077091 RepID=A0A2S7SUG6_9BACT|nr:choice-of-anchor L domain-containing protein [Flavipsychrobacter stenotrophus]PQJ10572.1 hypothetical protein CJD36_011395 [Flavipsychrobacter stenotrophus]
MRKIYLLFALMISTAVLKPLASSAQLVITPSVTAAALANKLVGTGVIIIAPTLTCPTVANGTFVGPSTLSFDSGIVLSSGRVLTAPGTPGSNGPQSLFASTNTGAGGDPQLTALAGQPTFDRCILEFDFRPAGDTVKFNYVFGSEEYNGYTCSSFNDVFGFFISGPGFASPTNIALVPGTTIPVCINSVNCSTGAICTSLVGPGAPYCPYYVNNTAGTTITYYGLTTTLQAIASVTPCDTYHLKIGIADGTDHIYDSGVFIEAGSLTSTGINVHPVGMNSADTTTGGQYCIRGCLPGQFVFNISNPMAGNFSIHYAIGGTAVNGVDYSTIADSVVIPAGGTSATLFINPLVVTPATGIRTIKLYILSPYTCGAAGPVIIDSAVMNIYDGFYVHIVNPDTTICEGQSVHITGQGDTSLTYSWTPLGTTAFDTLQVDVMPTNTTTYVLTGILTGAGCPSASDSMRVTVIHPFIVDVGPTIQNTCVGVPLILHASVFDIGGGPATGSFSYNWNPTTYMTGATTANPIVTPTVAGDLNYSLTVTEVSAGCTAPGTLIVHVLPNDFALLNPDSVICFNGIIPMRVNGDTEFSYHWEPNGFVNNANIINPIATISASTVFTVTASYPGCPDMVHTVNLTVESPNVDIRTKDTAFCVGDSIKLDVVAGPPGQPYTLSWTPTTYLINETTLTPTFVSDIVGDYPYTITITSPNGCVSTDMVTLSPRPPAHIGITPGSGIVGYGEHIQLDAVNLTSYPLIYWWTPNDGTLDNPNINNPIAVITDSVTFVVYAMNEWGCRDSASVTLQTIDGNVEFVPSAFTPNGDGLNDIFRIINVRYHKLVMFNVYNRWGELVYHNDTDPKKGWDGTFNGVAQDMGIFHYMIVIGRADGKLREYKGDVTLIR